MRYLSQGRTRALISALFFTLSACGNTPSGEDDPTPGDPAAAAQFVEDALTLIAEAGCSAGWECPEYNPYIVEIASRYGSEAECVAASRAMLYADEGTALLAQINAGRLVLDSALAANCLEGARAEIAQAKCRSDLSEVLNDELPLSCKDALVGNVAAGGACTSGEECSGELFCEIADDACEGVCRLQPCGDTVCAAGQACVSDAIGASCKPTRALGESCGAQSPCELELSCYYEGAAGTAAEGVCIAQGSLAAGAPCDNFSEQCGEGFWCDQNLCVQNPPQPQPQPAGSSCDYHKDCVAGLLCTDRICAAPVASPLGADGDACGPLPERPCGLGLACQSVDRETYEGTCAPHGEQGAPCDRSAQCVGGLSCTSSRDDQGVLTPGTCEPPRPVGQPCNEAEDCTTLRCDQGLCAVALAACVVP